MIDRTDPSLLRRFPDAAWRPVRMILRLLLLGGLLLGAGILAWRFHGPAEKPAAETPAAETGRREGSPTPVVAVAPVVKGEMALTLDGLGTVTPLATVTVRTRISGQLTQIGFAEGQMVKTGDFLAEIDPRPYRIAVDQAEGQLRRDEALLKNARLDLERYRKLVKQDSIARQQLDTQDSLVRQYEGTVEMDRAQLDSARLNLDYCRITAPVSGRIGLRQVDLGNYLQPSDANGIAIITQLQPISVVFTLAEDHLPSVTRQLASGRKLPVTAFDRSRTETLAEGILASLDSQIDTTTGTVRLKAEFDNRDRALFPNQFVNVRLRVDTLKDAAIVPAAAILRGAPGTYVYRLDGADKVAVQPVKLGPQDAANAVVLSGLEPGMKVVVDGTDRLRDGMNVKPREAGNAEEGAKTASPASPEAPPRERKKHRDVPDHEDRGREGRQPDRRP